MLSVPPLILLAMPAATACETIERLDPRGAVLVRAGAFASQVTSGEPRVDRWRSREGGEQAGSADLPGGRWGEWSSNRFAQTADDGSAWTGSRELTGRGLVLVSSFLSMAGDSATPDGRWTALAWEPAAPMRFEVEPGRRGDPLAGPLGTDCERSRLFAPVEPSFGVGDGGSSAGYRHEPGDSPGGAPPSARMALTERFPTRGALGYPGDELAPTEFNGDGSGGRLRPWRTATDMSPSSPDLDDGAGTRIEPGTALGFDPDGSRDLGESSLANRRAYPGDRIDWNGHGHVALSGLCFESEGRGGC